MHAATAAGDATGTVAMQAVPGPTEATATSAKRNTQNKPAIDAVALDDATNPSSRP